MQTLLILLSFLFHIVDDGMLHGEFLISDQEGEYRCEMWLSDREFFVNSFGFEAGWNSRGPWHEFDLGDLGCSWVDKQGIWRQREIARAIRRGNVRDVSFDSRRFRVVFAEAGATSHVSVMVVVVRWMR